MVANTHGDPVDDHGINYRIWIFYGSWAIYLYIVLKFIVTWMDMVIIGFVSALILVRLILMAIGYPYQVIHVSDQYEGRFWMLGW